MNHHIASTRIVQTQKEQWLWVFFDCSQTVQKIGNIELPLHNGKEEWMGPLYKWIAFYTDEVKDFLDRLADVEDEDGSKF